MFLKKNLSLLNEGYKNNHNLFDKGEGSKIYSRKKKYLDLSFAAGSLILGHNSKIYKLALRNLIRKKISTFAAPNTQAYEYSNLLKKILPDFSKFIFSNSGTEAVIKSLRISKAINKKNIIISVTGSWHGSVDRLLFSPGKNTKILPLSDGLSDYDKKNIKFIPYNDIEKSSKILSKYKSKISCIIIEPVQGCLPQTEIKKYLNFLRKFTKRNNCLLIFDEMVTGLRVNCSSVQSYFNIKPDITTFGKIFGGGLPIGIIAVSKKIEKTILKKKLKIFFGGTFSGNSLTTYIGKLTLEFILKNKSKIFTSLNQKASLLQNSMNQFIKEKHINARVYRFHSLIRLVFTKGKVKNRIQRDFLELKNFKNIKKFRSFLFKKGIYYPTSGIIFISTQTSNADIKKIIKTFKAGLIKYIH